MTTGSTNRLIPQDVQLVEDSITSETYENDVFLDSLPIQLSSHQQSTSNSTFREEPTTNSELYMESADNAQYAVGSIVIQTVPDNKQSKNIFSNVVSSQVCVLFVKFFFKYKFKLEKLNVIIKI